MPTVVKIACSAVRTWNADFLDASNCSNGNLLVIKSCRIVNVAVLPSISANRMSDVIIRLFMEATSISRSVNDVWKMSPFVRSFPMT